MSWCRDMDFTHAKRQYFAKCSQWTGTNLNEISDMLRSLGYQDFYMHSDTVMARGMDKQLLCIHANYWLRVGENRAFKVMSPEEFALKYVRIK